MNSSAQHPQGSVQRTPRPKRRPASIAELAQRAKDDAYDERREIKQHLRDAEKYRRTAKELVKAGDLETAFVEFAKAATLVLEKLPTHRDYLTTLNKEQRSNLALVSTPLRGRFSI
jgi:STAM-binding protein